MFTQIRNVEGHPFVPFYIYVLRLLASNLKQKAQRNYLSQASQLNITATKHKKLIIVFQAVIV